MFLLARRLILDDPNHIDILIGFSLDAPNYARDSNGINPRDGGMTRIGNHPTGANVDGVRKVALCLR